MDDPFGPDARHVDVAILHGLGQTERAQHLARQLRSEVITFDGVLTDADIETIEAWHGDKS